MYPFVRGGDRHPPLPFYIYTSVLELERGEKNRFKMVDRMIDPFCKFLTRAFSTNTTIKNLFTVEKYPGGCWWCFGGKGSFQECCRCRRHRHRRPREVFDV